MEILISLDHKGDKTMLNAILAECLSKGERWALFLLAGLFVGAVMGGAFRGR